MFCWSKLEERKEVSVLRICHLRLQFLHAWSSDACGDSAGYSAASQRGKWPVRSMTNIYWISDATLLHSGRFAPVHIPILVPLLVFIYVFEAAKVPILNAIRRSGREPKPSKNCQLSHTACQPSAQHRQPPPIVPLESPFLSSFSLSASSIGECSSFVRSRLNERRVNEAQLI